MEQARNRHVALWMRLSVLVPFLVGALALHIWSRTADPRFYLFVQTGTGQVLARIFRWHTYGGKVQSEDKPESEFTKAELQVKRELEELIVAQRPAHVLVLTDGKELRGEIQETTPTHVKFREDYDDNGSLALNIRRARVRGYRKNQDPVPAVSYRDVQFRMEFPGMNFYKRPPHTIVTDESFFRVEGTVRELRGLHRRFLETFGEVVTATNRTRSVQVLFFADENRFRAYQEKYAPGMESSAGFYSPWHDRFVLFNQLRSDALRSVGADLARQEQQYLSENGSHEVRKQVQAWRRANERKIAGVAEDVTRVTIRHEGAHQLFFTHGVHSSYRMENDWLCEGLACYAEPWAMGEVTSLRRGVVQAARRDRTMIPLDELVNHRSVLGLLAYEEVGRVDEAYAQSWALTHFLMQPAYREGFFDYIRLVRDRERVRELLKRPRIDVLCETVGITKDKLQRAWNVYVHTL